MVWSQLLMSSIQLYSLEWLSRASSLGIPKVRVFFVRTKLDDRLSFVVVTSLVVAINLYSFCSLGSSDGPPNLRIWIIWTLHRTRKSMTWLRPRSLEFWLWLQTILGIWLPGPKHRYTAIRPKPRISATLPILGSWVRAFKPRNLTPIEKSGIQLSGIRESINTSVCHVCLVSRSNVSDELHLSSAADKWRVAMATDRNWLVAELTRSIINLAPRAWNQPCVGNLGHSKFVLLQI